MVLPVVERELRVAARRRFTYRTRLVAVFALLVAFAYIQFGFGREYRSAALQGGLLFRTFSTILFVFAAIAGMLCTTDCMSSEKRDGTLGLLFLTDLKGYDVICGKLTANSVAVIYGLLASVPILSIPILMGGINAMQFVKVALLLVTTLALSCSVGVLISTYSRNERRGTFFAVLTMLFVIFGPVLVGAIVGSRPHSSEIAVVELINFSPAAALFILLMDGQMGTPPPAIANFFQYHIWITLGWMWLLIALFLVRASRFAPRSWQDAPRNENVLNQSLKVPLRKWRPSRALLDLNPYLWLALQAGETTPRAVLGFVLAILAIWGCAWVKYGTYMLEAAVVSVTVIVLNVFLKIWVVGEASRRFVADTQNDSLEFLLCTPITQRTIIGGQFRALLKLFGLPLVLVMTWEAMVIWNKNSYFEPTHYTTLGTALFLVFDAVALACTGMWYALKWRGLTRVMLTSIGLVLIVPAAGDFLTQQLADMWRASTRSSSWATTDLESMRVQFVIAAKIVFDIIVIAWARANISRNFRQFVTERPAAKA